MVQEGERKMLAAGVTGPEGHAQAHTEEAETEAVMRAAVIANQVGIKVKDFGIIDIFPEIIFICSQTAPV